MLWSGFHGALFFSAAAGSRVTPESDRQKWRKVVP